MIAGAVASALVSRWPIAPAKAASERTVAYGDSIAHMLAANNPGVVNLGIGGMGLINGPDAEKARLKAFVSQIKPGDTVLVSLGTNDTTYLMHGSVPMDRYKGMLTDRLKAIQDQGGRPIMLGTSSEGYTASTKKWNDYLNGPMNDAVRDVAKSLKIPYLPTGTGQYERGPDRLHYSAGGFHKLRADAEALAKSVDQPQAKMTQVPAAKPR